jgi:HTH-type transcriptional repressor of NAD biosynthesis genes
MKKKYKNGLVIGKFMPFHNGHKSLIDFALLHCEKVYVLVDHLLKEKISVKKRKDWIKKTYKYNKNVIVNGFKEYMPQEEKESNLFWNIWDEKIKDFCNPDVLFASEKYGIKLSKVLGCEFIPFDINRNVFFDISATKIRNNIVDNFDYLPNEVKKDYVLKYVLIGPESTYKSSIGKEITENNIDRISYIPEYAEKYIKDLEIKKIMKKDLEIFFYTQKAYIKLMIKTKIKQNILIDSDYLTTYVYYKLLFKKVPKKYEKELNKNTLGKTYLLFRNDNEYINDSHRIISEEECFRNEWFNECEKIKKKLGLKYHIIEGSYEEKKEKVVKLILK